jgi:hypothetical protein
MEQKMITRSGTIFQSMLPVLEYSPNYKFQAGIWVHIRASRIEEVKNDA